jgi:hypothetical protein
MIIIARQLLKEKHFMNDLSDIVLGVSESSYTNDLFVTALENGGCTLVALL